MTADDGLLAGFRSLEAEVTDHRLPTSGSVPEWLSGALIRNGPGRFESGDDRVSHWFDGLAMLRRYAFDDGTIRYTNRFLRTEAHAAARDGSLEGQFGTDVGFARRLAAWVQARGPPTPTDNASVHVARLGDHYVALTEAPRRVAFDPVTLETHGEFRWRDDLPEHLATAHLTVDPTSGETIGYATTFGRNPQYHVYRIENGTATRELIASVPAIGPGYVHDCSVTPNYVVLVETPLRIAIWRALTPWGDDGLLDALVYDHDRPVRFVVIDRDTGDLVAEPRTDPFFTFHHANAFEDDDTLVLDLVAFPDGDVVDGLTLEALSQDGFDAAPDGRLRRFRIDPHASDDRVVREQATRYPGGLEFPTVAPSARSRPYRFLYGQTTDRRGANGLVKLDLETGTATEWWKSGWYVEEPRFVPRPGGAAEDDGVVLATAIDVEAAQSLVLVFDAETLSERARATLPHVAPFGFHGRFFPDAA
ncbi:Lignostilbene-alpha,beta-dioxygenase or related enzyme [Natrarchaeobaculum sulfurireducens]|uniref:Lignostilbene-alpha,beta-dioxygenase or related enzyme n=2 Tax=Natrarchaeobaculum sulfurireducens TaxID=2044521 RepID=A0A346PCB5_9EURY|nr:Lignostilbene-alpha,beta-dioxygenase or related enzyme [Natrarchaeobaculum sulfurireducens]